MAEKAQKVRGSLSTHKRVSPASKRSAPTKTKADPHADAMRRWVHPIIATPLSGRIMRCRTGH